MNRISVMENFNYIHPDALIGDNVKIEAFSTIQKNVKIGKGTWIGPNVSIMEGARIGQNCKIFPGAVISSIPQDLKFNGENSLVEIGDNTTVREYVTINRGTAALGMTRIGSNCHIMSYSHVAHDCNVGNYCIFSNNSTLAGHVTIGNYVVLSGFSAVQQFCNIGDYVFLAGGSHVRKDIPPFVKAGRQPLSFLGVNTIGLNRNGFSKEKINYIQSLYRIIFQSNLNTSQSLKVLKEEHPDNEIKSIIFDFLCKSNNGIIKGYF